MSSPEDEAHEAHHHVEHESIEDVRAERVLLERAIGGWRGIIDSGLPTAVFITAYVLTDQSLTPSVIAAVAAGVLIALWRLIRRESLQQVGTGFGAVLVAAVFTRWTGRAEDFFLPGLITNVAYGTAFLVSVLVRWPLLGVIVGFITGSGTSWRQDPAQRRVFAAASWLWVGLFFGRLIVQVPLYLAEAVELLGIVKIVMGWPLFLATAYFTYRLLKPTFDAQRAN